MENLDSKTCSSCSVEKPLAEFQKRAASKDGLTAACKKCLKERDSNKHVKFREKRLEAMRNYAKTEAAKISHAESVLKWRAANHDKMKAHIAVGHAIARGNLNKLPCVICGSEKVEAHHPDYSAPLDVVWLCAAHHKQLHHQQEKHDHEYSN